MLIQICKPDFSYSDERGELVQLCHDGYKQYNIIFSKKNVVRGNHYHKDNTELFYVINGAFELIVQKEEIIEKYHFVAGDMFVVPPYIMHSFLYTEDTLLASMYDIGVEYSDGTKDIHI